MVPIFFPKQKDFRKWLEKNHDKETELLVGFYKVNSGKPSITWSQSVDEALCFGWIDGIRKSIDSESYSIRFTPRKPNSNWSAVNIKKIGELKRKGLMRPAGIEAFKRSKENKSKIYSYENDTVKFNPDYEKKFKANKIAWDFFYDQANYYKKIMAKWVMSAKQTSTQLNRLEKLIKASEAGEKIY